MTGMEGDGMLSALGRTLIVYAAVIVAMRLMGKRQLGELQPAELVTALLISNVASICIEDPDLPLLASLCPILLITALEILNSSLAWYCPHYAALLFGRPVTVVRNGQVNQQALAYLRISAADLAQALRGKDIFCPQDAAWGVIEPNGSLSVAPQPGDGQPPTMLPLLIDGQLYLDNLSALGLDIGWLDAFLQQNELRRSQVLMLLHDGRRPFLIAKHKGRPAREGGAARKGTL